MATPKWDLDTLVEGQAGAEVTVNDALNILDTLAFVRVKSHTTAAQPVSPAEGDAYVIPSSGVSGTDWTGQENKVAVYFSGWRFFAPVEGWHVWVDDEDAITRYDGAAWTNFPALQTSPAVAAAGTDQAGATALTKEVSRVNSGTGGVRLPAAAQGLRATVLNERGGTLDVFPASGDAINDLATNAAQLLLDNAHVTYFAVNATNWYSIP